MPVLSLFLAAIIAGGALFALHLSAPSASAGKAPAPGNVTSRRPISSPHGAVAPDKRYAVVIVLDGARPGYFNLTPMPHLQALEKRGATYSNAFVGQLIANTPPSHATIGTGSFPKHDGVPGFSWEDPRTRLAVDPTETGSVLNGDLERAIKDSGTPTLAGQIHKKYPKAKVAAVAGHKCYASDAMGTGSADYILCALIYHNRWVAQAVGDHRPPPGAINNPHWDVPIPPRTAGFGAAVQQWKEGGENSWSMKYALWAFKRIHYPRVLMVNLSETDVLGHFAKSKVKTARFLMKRFDRLLGELETAYRKAGILNRTDFVITADHGMSRINRFIPYGVLSGAVTDAGTTQVFIEHDTAAAIYIADNAKAQAVAQNVLRLGGSAVDATYYKVRVHGEWSYRLGAAQPGLKPSLLHAFETLADTTASDAGPAVLAIFAPHASARQIVAYGYPWRAGHLGPQWDDQHIPLIIAGPGVRSGLQSSYPARLVDIAPTIEHLLGAPTGKVDGVVLADALRHAGAAMQGAERERGAVLTPIVKALQQHSGYP